MRHQLHDLLLHETVVEAVDVEEAGWVVSVTVKVRFRPNRCEVVTPLAVLPSPKFQP